MGHITNIYWTSNKPLCNNQTCLLHKCNYYSIRSHNQTSVLTNEYDYSLKSTYCSVFTSVNSSLVRWVGCNLFLGTDILWKPVKCFWSECKMLNLYIHKRTLKKPVEINFNIQAARKFTAFLRHTAQSPFYFPQEPLFHNCISLC